NDDVVSDWTAGRYATLAGTSMAAAHVSGALALLFAQGLTNGQAVDRVLHTASSCSGCDNGRLDVSAAVGTGSAPAPAASAGGSGSRPPGAATVVGQAPRRASAPAVKAPARPAAAPNSTTPAPAAAPPTSAVAVPDQTPL